jgi:hypothetical protein
MPAQKVQMWQCPLTKKLFKTQEEADRCTRSAKAAATRKENKEKYLKETKELCLSRSKYLMENAESLHDIIGLFVEKSKEFWGIKITDVKISSVSFIEKDMQWSFRMSMQADELSSSSLKIIRKINRDLGRDTGCFMRPSSISNLMLSGYRWEEDVIGIGFLGISCGSGNTGLFGHSTYSMDTRIKISQFPKIYPKMIEYVDYRNKLKNFDMLRDTITRESQLFSEKSNQYSTVFTELCILKKAVECKRSELEEIRKRGMEIYTKVGLKGVEDKRPHICPEIEDLFENSLVNFNLSF